MTPDLVVQVRLVHCHARVPVKAHEHDACYDVHVAHAGAIAPGRREVIDTGHTLHIPRGWRGILKERSGHGAKHGIMLIGGVIDTDYPDTVKVILYNSGDQLFHFKTGDRIAQLKFERVEDARLDIITEAPQRGQRQGGLGSTGTS